jgi:hypothetical protein
MLAMLHIGHNMLTRNSKLRKIGNYNCSSIKEADVPEEKK